MGRFFAWGCGVVGRGLARLDAWANALYGWRANPLYRSGSVVVWAFGVLVVTGLYLVFEYRIGSPYGSVAGLGLVGGWVRAVHRYAADVAVVAAGVHALRMGLEGRSWGPRARAWVSGVVLLGVLLVCGWTGYVLVWDVQAQVLVEEGARWLDLWPLFGEPLGRLFAGDAPVPGAFFFLNLFVHLALPVGLCLVLWVHVSRVARPQLWPPRALAVGLGVGLAVLAAVWAAPLGPPADPLRVPGRVPLDGFYLFWLPWLKRLPAAVVWVVLLAVVGVVCLVPVWARPRGGRPAPSAVDERLCTGCRQCVLDCPYEAVEMVARADGRVGEVARVRAELCVSCGICAGSCAPMGIGPPGRTGRDQLAAVRAWWAEGRAGPGSVVLVACERGAGGVAVEGVVEGAPVWAVSCLGNLHTSVVEWLVRAGAAVLVVGCPPRDCREREGAVWLEERLYRGREAELQARVDRARVRLVWAGAGERGRVCGALRAFRESIAGLGVPVPEGEVVLAEECEPVPLEAGRGAGGWWRGWARWRAGRALGRGR